MSKVFVQISPVSSPSPGRFHPGGISSQTEHQATVIGPQRHGQCPVTAADVDDEPSVGPCFLEELIGRLLRGFRSRG